MGMKCRFGSEKSMYVDLSLSIRKIRNDVRREWSLIVYVAIFNLKIFFFIARSTGIGHSRIFSQVYQALNPRSHSFEAKSKSFS